MSKITKSLVTKILNGMKFDPTEPGPNRLIFYHNSREYHLTHAKICILRLIEGDSSGTLTSDAIRHLVLAHAIEGGASCESPKPKSKKQ
jgi:hypothetical protein